MKITKPDLMAMFGRLAKAMNKPIDGGQYNGLHLDYVPCYGGYKIVEYSPEKGELEPFGSARRSKTEMYYSMLMAAQALEEVSYRQELLNKYERV